MNQKNTQKPPSNLPTENEQRQKRILKDLELVYQIGFDDWFCGHWKRYPHVGAQNYPLLKTSCFINEDQKTWDGIKLNLWSLGVVSSRKDRTNGKWPHLNPLKEGVSKSLCLPDQPEVL